MAAFVIETVPSEFAQSADNATIASVKVAAGKISNEIETAGFKLSQGVASLVIELIDNA